MLRWLKKWNTWIWGRIFLREYFIKMQNQKDLTEGKVVWVTAFNVHAATEIAKRFKAREDGEDGENFKVVEIRRL